MAEEKTYTLCLECANCDHVWQQEFAWGTEPEWPLLRCMNCGCRGYVGRHCPEPPDEGFRCPWPRTADHPPAQRRMMAGSDIC